MAKLTHAQIAFLLKVERRGVFRAVGYSLRRGGYRRFVGGEKTAQAMANAGLIKMPYVADLGRPSYAELTEAGRQALAAAAPHLLDGDEVDGAVSEPQAAWREV